MSTRGQSKAALKRKAGWRHVPALDDDAGVGVIFTTVALTRLCVATLSA